MIAKCREETCIEPIDFYSMNHIIFGWVTYPIIYAITFLIGLETLVIPALSLLISTLIFVVWELMENSLLVQWKMKFDGIDDTCLNSQMDVVFGFLGAICSFLAMFFVPLWVYVLISVIVIQTLVILIIIAYMKIR